VFHRLERSGQWLGVHPKLEKEQLEIGLFGCPKCLSAHIGLFGHVLTNKGRNRRYRCLECGHTFHSDDGFYYSREELTKNHIHVHVEGSQDLPEDNPIEAWKD
jgi:tRNA(Ile2) C34 agmatinyltransferase TiaS